MIYTVYAEHDDITFIMEEEKQGNQVKVTVKGFYYGEPNEEDTKCYMDDLTAVVELEE